MYPFNVILIGCPPEAHRAVRRGIELSGAIVEAEFPDLLSTLRKVAAADGRRLLFVAALRDEQDLSDLRQLGAAFPGQPILGLRPGPADPYFFNNALRSGAAFLVGLPVEGDELTMALEWVARPYGGGAARSVVVAVAGVVGGCGATSLAVNLAIEAERLHQRSVLLIELALRLGVIAAHLDLEPKHSIHDLLGLGELDLGLIRQLLTPVAPHLQLLPGPSTPVRPENIRTADILRIVEYSKALADLIVVDVPCTYDDLYFDVLAAADHYVLVLEQSVPAVRSFRMVHEALQARKTAGRGYFVVNRYNPRLKGFSLEDLQKLQAVPKLWSIAADPTAFTAAVNNGRSLFQEAPNSPGLADIDALAAALVGAPPPTRAATKPNLFARLVRACRLA